MKSKFKLTFLILLIVIVLSLAVMCAYYFATKEDGLSVKNICVTSDAEVDLGISNFSIGGVNE